MAASARWRGGSRRRSLISTRASTIQTEDDGVSRRHGPVSLVGCEVNGRLFRCCHGCRCLSRVLVEGSYLAICFVGGGCAPRAVASKVCTPGVRLCAVLVLLLSCDAARRQVRQVMRDALSRSDGRGALRFARAARSMLRNDCRDCFAPACSSPWRPMRVGLEAIIS